MSISTAEAMAIEVLKGNEDAARQLADYLLENVYNKDVKSIPPMQVIEPKEGFTIKVVVWLKENEEFNGQERRMVANCIREWLNGRLLLVFPDKVARFELFQLPKPEAVVMQLDVTSVRHSPGRTYHEVTHCHHCNANTDHRCYTTGDTITQGPRDISNDWRRCLRCQWLWTGTTRRYEPPDNWSEMEQVLESNSESPSNNWSNRGLMEQDRVGIDDSLVDDSLIGDEMGPVLEQDSGGRDQLSDNEDTVRRQYASDPDAPLLTEQQFRDYILEEYPEVDLGGEG